MHACSSLCILTSHPSVPAYLLVCSSLCMFLRFSINKLNYDLPPHVIKDSQRLNPVFKSVLDVVAVDTDVLPPWAGSTANNAAGSRDSEGSGGVGGSRGGAAGFTATLGTVVRNYLLDGPKAERTVLMVDGHECRNLVYDLERFRKTGAYQVRYPVALIYDKIAWSKSSGCLAMQLGQYRPAGVSVFY